MKLLLQQYAAYNIWANQRIFDCINNLADDFFTPNSLDYAVGSNQQARVDLMLASSDPFSVDAGDVLQNLFQTKSGDPLTSGYNLVSADITSILASHAGEELRLQLRSYSKHCDLTCN